MDCGDVMRLLGTTEQRSMTAAEVGELREHAVGCASCRALAERPIEGPWRWLVRVPAKSLEAPELGMPMVDRAVFGDAVEVATGGMGRVSRAVDRRLGREVAVKELRVERSRWRFEREVRITARLQHPAIVPIYEAGAFPDGASFYTMRLVPGRTLQEAIEAAATLADRLRLMPHVRAIADALGYAHSRGVIHRDLKPANVLVGEFGETVVIDWGIAKERDREDDAVVDEPAPAQTKHTRAGAVMGTPGYMSPAQAAGDPADETDDVYAIGAILYTVLAGKRPYSDAGDDASAVIAATVLDPVTPIDELAPEAPADLRAICARAMARDKAERFPTAVELAEELARFEAGQLLRSRAYTLRELLVRWLRRHRRAVALGALGVVALALLVVVWVRYRRAAEELALRERGAQLAALYGEAARQAYRVDRDLLRLERAVEGLAAASAWALAGPEPAEADAPVFFDVHFADAQQRPTDFAKGTAYRWDVSVEHPVVSVAPNVPRAALMPKIRRLSPLRHHIRAMVLEAANASPTAPDANAILRRRDSLIDYAYVDLDEGVHMVWPGMASLKADYDVREAAFYRESANRRGTRLGPPYVDSTTDRDGDDLVLPCTRGVWSQRGTFLGVAGVELTVTKLVETSMALRTRATLRATLVDGAARTVIDSINARKRFPSSGRDEAVALPAFDLPDVAAAILAEREGLVETQRDDRAIVAAVVRLEAIGWYYVVEVDADSLGAR